MPLARFDRPFEHPDWIFEPKMDGFRAVAYVEGGTCRLVSRNHNPFKTFAPLAQAIGQDLSGRAAILDGEIIRPGPDWRPLFYELMRAAGHSASLRSTCSGWMCATCGTGLWLSRRHSCGKLVPRPSRAVLYVEHVASGTDLFRLICERDMEGVVAKQVSASYTPESTTWVKIKNRAYSQAIGREDFFDRRRAAK
jgi:bifunctional non-homologous end joining protein LigD